VATESVRDGDNVVSGLGVERISKEDAGGVYQDRAMLVVAIAKVGCASGGVDLAVARTGLHLETCLDAREIITAAPRAEL